MFNRLTKPTVPPVSLEAKSVGVDPQFVPEHVNSIEKQYPHLGNARDVELSDVRNELRKQAVRGVVLSWDVDSSLVDVIDGFNGTLPNLTLSHNLTDPEVGIKYLKTELQVKDFEAAELLAKEVVGLRSWFIDLVGTEDVFTRLSHVHFHTRSCHKLQVGGRPHRDGFTLGYTFAFKGEGTLGFGEDSSSMSVPTLMLFLFKGYGVQSVESVPYWAERFGLPTEQFPADVLEANHPCFSKELACLHRAGGRHSDTGRVITAGSTFRQPLGLGGEQNIAVRYPEVSLAE